MRTRLIFLAALVASCASAWASTVTPQAITRVAQVQMRGGEATLTASGPSLTLRLPSLLVALDGAAHHGSPALASDGEHVLAVWSQTDRTGSSVHAELFGSRAQSKRQPLTLAAAAENAGDPRHPGTAAVWLGSSYGVAYLTGGREAIKFVRIDRRGRALGTPIDIPVIGPADWLRMTVVGSDAVLAWIDHGRKPFYGIRLARVTRDGAVNVIDLEAPEQAGAFSLAAFADQVVVVHDERRRIGSWNDLDQYAVFVNLVEGTQHRLPVAVDDRSFAFDPAAMSVGSDIVVLSGWFEDDRAGLDLHRLSPGGSDHVDRLVLADVRDITSIMLSGSGRALKAIWWDDRVDGSPQGVHALPAIDATRGFLERPSSSD